MPTRNPVQRQPGPVWHARGQGFESPQLHPKVFTFDLGLSSRLGLTFSCVPGVFPAGAGFRAGLLADALFRAAGCVLRAVIWWSGPCR
jgi:hypothetical protein